MKIRKNGRAVRASHRIMAEKSYTMEEKISNYEAVFRKVYPYLSDEQIRKKALAQIEVDSQLESQIEERRTRTETAKINPDEERELYSMAWDRNEQKRVAKFIDLVNSGKITKSNFYDAIRKYFTNRTLSDHTLHFWESFSEYAYDLLFGDVKASRRTAKRRVMAAKRSIHFTVTVTDTDEIIDVLEDQDEAIEVARKYTQKYGDSATVEKEWIGSDGDVYDSTVCFQTDGNFNSSTKIAKRPIKASRPIMAGAGAGYNIEWSLNRITSVHSFTPISTEVDQYGDVIVDAECDIDADITINAANSYYEGASDLDLDTTAKISRISIEIYVGDDESADDVIANLPYMNAQELDSILYSMGATTGGDRHSGEWKSSLGGGWIHSTFNGVLADADDPHSVIDGFDGWTVTLTDKEVIDYIDQVVTGEDTYTGYALYDQDGEYIDKFDNLMDAQNKAEELIASGDYESIECVREDTKIYFDGTSEEVYNETEFVLDEPADI